MADDEKPLLTGIRNESDGSTVRVVLELTASATIQSFTLSDPARVAIDIKNADTTLGAYDAVIEDGLLKKIRVGRPTQDVTRVVLDLAYLTPYQTKASDDGITVTVEIPRTFKEETKKVRINESAVLTTISKMMPYGPITAHVLDLNMRGGRLNVRLGLGLDKIGGREKLSKLSSRRKADIAVNGGYFIMESGKPIDMLIYEGKLLVLPERFRGFFGIDKKGKPLFIRPVAEMSISLPDKRPRYVQRLNCMPDPGQISVFTPDYGLFTGTAPNKKEVVVKNGTIDSFSQGNSPIPADGFVISTDESKSDFLNTLKIGDPISLIVSSYPAIEDIEYGVSAGPTLISRGEVQNTLVEDFSINSGIVAKRNPRTAVGVSSDNHLIFVIVEGRSVYSAGMSLDELAVFMKSLGITEAINLDGGGSTELVVGNKIMNRLSGGDERPVANAFLINFN